MSVPALTAIVIALGLLLSGCQGGPAVGAEEPKSKASAPPPREVRVTPAAERTVARTVSATGTLAADEQVVLGTKVGGRQARSERLQAARGSSRGRAPAGARPAGARAGGL